MSRLAWLLLTCMFGAPTLAAEVEQRRVIADAQVVVQSDGSVSAVSLLRPEWPEALVAAAEAQIRQLAFEPLRINGAPAEVASSIRFSACLSVDSEQVALALDPVDFGPQVARGFDAFPRPRSGTFGSGGGHFAFTLKFRVHADGSATLDTVAAPELSEWRRKRIFAGYGEWFSHARFVPEQVNGTPVETQMVWPLTVTVAQSRSALRGKDETATAPSCLRARDALDASSGPRIAEGEPRLRLRPADS